MNWRPIETAPKDGTKILLLLKDSDVSHAGYYKQRYGWRIAWDNHDLSEYDGPTHWMPLPPPPSTAPQDTGELIVLQNLLTRYVNLVNSGDAGHWDPETEDEVIAARNLLAGHDPANVVILDRETAEEVKEAFEYGCVSNDAHTRELSRSALTKLTACMGGEKV